MDAARALAAVQRNENNVREHYEGIRVMYGKDRVAGIYKEKPGAGQQGGQSRQQQQSGGATRSRDGPHQRQQPYPRSRPNAPSAGAASAPRNGQSTGVAAPQSSAGETPVVGIL